MTDALGVDSDVVELLRCAALDKKPVTHLLALLRLTHDPAGENSFSYFTVLHYFEEAFDWNIRQIGALKTSSYFADKPWPDEALNARYAPQLEAWRKNPSTYPRPERMRLCPRTPRRFQVPNARRQWNAWRWTGLKTRSQRPAGQISGRTK